MNRGIPSHTTGHGDMFPSNTCLHGLQSYCYKNIKQTTPNYPTHMSNLSSI